MTPCKVFFEQPGTIFGDTYPTRLHKPKTMILLLASGPEAALDVFHGPVELGWHRALGLQPARKCRYNALTERTLRPLSWAASEAVNSRAKSRNR